MNTKDYDQKKQECWDALHNELLKGEVQWQPVSRKDIFNYVFDRAFALGKEKEPITQEEIEKAAEKFADDIKIPASIPGIMVPFINGIAHDSYLQGAQDFLGKQEKDAEDTVIKGWVARDADGDMFLYQNEPDRIEITWFGYMMHSLPKDSFPDLTWDDDPIEVELIIKRKKKNL